MKFDPARDYPRLNRRLVDWGGWVRSQYAEAIGWGAVDLDAGDAVRVQRRNDMHADRVLLEIMTMRGEHKRILTTDSAWRGLPKLWRQMVWLDYVDGVTRIDMAARSGIHPRDVATHYKAAFIELDNAIFGLQYARTG